jgi:hypothetical protein
VYQIQLAQGAAVPSVGTTISAMNASSIVQVRDTQLTAGQNPELFLFGSNPAAPNTFVRSRGPAVASPTTGGPGAAETITHTPPRSGWYGVVVLNVAGAGNYTVTRALRRASPWVRWLSRSRIPLLWSVVPRPCRSITC